MHYVQKETDQLFPADLSVQLITILIEKQQKFCLYSPDTCVPSAFM